MRGYAVAHVGDIPELNDGLIPMRPLRHHLGIASFGINAWTGRSAGDRVISEHDESDRNEEDPDSPEELYLVLQGRAVFELDGERQDAPAGTLVFVPPGVRRTAFAEEPDTTIISVGAAPGKAYEPVGWELWMPIRPLYEAGEHAQVVERLREVVEANPQYGLLFYNLACCESLTGQTANALAHLRRSLELTERLRDYARSDSDLDAIRDEPSFKELVGG
jgi:tetratricopeptide (TPR) repeat protein